MSIPIWTRLLAVLLLTAGQLAHADDKPPTPSSPDYKMVPIKGLGGKTTYVQVQKDANPYGHVNSSGSSDTYDPERPDYSRASPMASKTFEAVSFSGSKTSTAFEVSEHDSFFTKSYEGNHSRADEAIPNLNTKASLPAPDTDVHGAIGFDKHFETSSSELTKDKPAMFASMTSSDQDRTAPFDLHAYGTSASPMANKTFPGSERQVIQRETTKIEAGQMQMKDLPDRPLTIDEVRALINHGIKPDTNAKPADPSKALDDPDYVPEVTPLLPPPSEPGAPPRAIPVMEDDSNDPVPSPGTMAQPPENSEALPQH